MEWRQGSQKDTRETRVDMGVKGYRSPGRLGNQGRQGRQRQRREGRQGRQQIQGRPSLSHANADGLSRLPLPAERPVCYSSEPTIFNIRHIEFLPVTANSIKNATGKDPIISKILQYTKCEWPS